MMKSHQPSAVSRQLAIIWAVPVLALVGCSLLTRAPEGAPLATSLQEIAPHGDRDHFVYVWDRIENGQVVASGIQVEHVSAVGDNEFEVTLSEDGAAVGHMRLREDARTLALLAEDDVTRGLRLVYEPPLVQFEMPLRGGERRASASATLSGLADGQAIGVIPVQQVIDVQPGPPVHASFVHADRSVIVRMQRTLQLPNGISELKTESLLVAGVGEISSGGTASDSPQIRRALACAIIGGRRFGDCTNLNQILEERRARPPHVR